MRNFLLAAAAVSFAAMTAPVAPASAGGSCCHDHGYHSPAYRYEYSYVTRYHVPPPVVYKHYLPDEDAFHPKPKIHTYVPWYAGWEYSRVPLYSYRSGYGHYQKHRHYSRYKRSRDWDDKYDRYDDDDDCRWLKRRAKESDSRYWWKRYEDCRY
jgi:hypothetical protein